MSEYNPEGMTLNIPEKLYVGVQNCKDFNKEDPPLAFAVPYGEGKKFEGPISTVKNWAGCGRTVITYKLNPEYNENSHYTDYYLKDENGRQIVDTETKNPEEGVIIDNELRDGYYFDKHVSRWQTSNKFFRITDPRGFQLEIDCENLGDILLNCAISQGYLVGKFQWTRYKGKAYLVREDHPARERRVNPKVKRQQKALVVGDVVKFSTEDGHWVYAGKVRALGFSTLQKRYQHISGLTTSARPELSWGSQGYWASYYERYIVDGDRNPDNYSPVLVSCYKKDDKAFNLFFPYGKHYNPYNKKLEMKRNPMMMRSQGTFELIDEGKEVPEIKWGEPMNITCISGSYFAHYYLLYKDKKTIDALDLTAIDFNSMAEKIRPYVCQTTRTHVVMPNGGYNVNVSTEARPPTIQPRELTSNDYYSQF